MVHLFFSRLAMYGLAALVMIQSAFASAALSDREQDLRTIIGGSDGAHGTLSGLQIVVLQDGVLTYSGAFGMATLSPDGQTTPLTPDHKMRVASISKFVLTTGLMRLVESGQIDLDADISGYLPFPIRNPNFPDVPIKVRHLLSHTSSIRDGEKYWLPYGQNFQSFFGKDSTHFASDAGQGPGQFFEYSNLNFGIAAAVLERVSGKRFDRFMKAQVFDPLHLNIGFSPCDITRSAPNRLASLFRRNTADGIWAPKGPWRVQVDGARVACYVGMEPVPRSATPDDDYFDAYTLASNPTLFSPQGGLRASAKDLARIMQIFIGDDLQAAPLIGAQSRRAMLQTEWALSDEKTNGKTYEGEKSNDASNGLMSAYGLSVHIADLKAWRISKEPKTLYGHLGEAYGVLGQFWFDPVTKSGFVALITGTSADPQLSVAGTSPLYRSEEEIMRWWLRHFEAPSAQ